MSALNTAFIEQLNNIKLTLEYIFTFKYFTTKEQFETKCDPAYQPKKLFRLFLEIMLWIHCPSWPANINEFY